MSHNHVMLPIFKMALIAIAVEYPPATMAFKVTRPELNGIEHLWDEFYGRVRRQPVAPRNLQELYPICIHTKLRFVNEAEVSEGH